MSDPIMGRDVTVEVILATATGTPVDGSYTAPTNGWLPLGGTRGLSKNAEWDTVDTTSRSSAGNVRSSTVTFLQVSGSIDGVYIPETAENIEATDEYVSNPPSGQPNAWIRLSRPAANGTDIVQFTTYAQLSSFSVEAPYDDVMTFSIDYQGKQPWLKTTVTP